MNQNTPPGGSSNGKATPPPSIEVVLSEPDLIVELSQSCRQFVFAKTGFELDGSADTLPVLDHYITVARSELDQRQEAVPLVAQAIGAYFGSIVQIEVAGFWRVPGSDVDGWRVCGRTVFLAINPIGVAYDALYGSEDHSGPASELELALEDRELVLPRLAALPAVRQEEYYSLSTRFEAIQIATAILREHMVDAGQGDVRFGPEDYADR